MMSDRNRAAGGTKPASVAAAKEFFLGEGTGGRLRLEIRLGRPMKPADEIISANNAKPPQPQNLCRGLGL
jgi:hypothetical protein